MTHDVATSQTNSLMVSSRDLVPPSERRWILPFHPKLTISPGWCAILTFGQGERRVLSEGRYRLDRHASWGLCQIQYVDMRPHLTPIQSVKSRCRDGWEAELALGVYWRVNDALLISNAVDPGSNLSTAAQASMRAVIEMMSHNAFAAGMGDSVIRAEELALAVATRLKHNPAIQGLEIINVFVTDRQGDKRRIEMVNDSATLSEQMEQHQQERKFKLLQAETNRLEEEERSQARIREAEIEIEVDKQLEPLKQREVEREQAAAASQQRHEQTLKMIEAQGQVLSKVAEFGMLELLDDSTRRRPEQAGNSMETILEGLSGLQNMVQDTHCTPSLGA